MYIDFKERGERERKENGREREKGRGEVDRGVEREREKHQLVVSCIEPTRDWTHNLGMCPDWESNLQSLGVWMMLHPIKSPGQD